MGANGYRGKVKLIYIDPPFDSGADYIRKVTLRSGAANLEGEGYARQDIIGLANAGFPVENYMAFKQQLHGTYTNSLALMP